MARSLYRLVIGWHGSAPGFFIFTAVLNGKPAFKSVLSYNQTFDFDREQRNEPETFAWIDQMNPDDVLYDIGASTGIFSLYAAMRGVSVYAFEPSRGNAYLLELNLWANRQNASVLNVALSDKEEMAGFFYADYAPGSHSNILGSANDRIHGAKFSPEFSASVMAMRLDDAVERFSLKPPTHLKIDVDGSEGRVLRGAVKTLERQTLREVLIEIDHPSADPRGAVAALNAAGFRETNRFQVGGYPGLFNMRFAR